MLATLQESVRVNREAGHYFAQDLAGDFGRSFFKTKIPWQKNSS
jgi:hypothetical protein